jgi:hypothetical protein
MRVYNVQLTCNTLASNAGEALQLALEVVATGRGFYAEVFDGETDDKVFDGCIEDITIEGVQG